MQHSARMIADAAGLADHDVAQLAKDAAALRPGYQPGPIHGFVIRHGQTVPYTLDTSRPMPEIRGLMPEQIAMAAIFMASVIGPIYHFFG